MDKLAGDHRRAASTPLLLPYLPDDLLVEFLLRLPPEPIHLFRASSVSKRWRGLVHDARFLRRFREFHGGKSPLLGFMENLRGRSRFIPTSGAFGVSASMMPHKGKGWRALDCRHGRALLETHVSRELLVWDLMTGDRRYLPLPPAFQFHMNLNSWDWHRAAVCAAGHGECRSCPFLVAFLFTHNDKTMASACIYSSRTGIWSEVTSSVAMPLETTLDSRATLIGNTLYWLSSDSSIFELDLDEHGLGVIEDVLPYSYGKHCSYDGQVIIMPAQNGQLGFARVDGFSLHLWSRAAASIDGVVTWTCRRVIDLDKFLAPEVLTGWGYLVLLKMLMCFSSMWT